MILRDERPDDFDHIDALVAAAFLGHPFSEGLEPRLIRRLRADGGLLLSRVATDAQDTLFGQIAFSPATIGATDTWVALGPIAVHPDRRRAGIGTALMRDGLERMRARGAAGVVLVGDPAFYTRFGFHRVAGLTMAGVPEMYILALAFTGPVPAGEIRHHPAFAAVLAGH